MVGSECGYNTTVLYVCNLESGIGWCELVQVVHKTTFYCSYSGALLFGTPDWKIVRLYMFTSELCTHFPISLHVIELFHILLIVVDCK